MKELLEKALQKCDEAEVYILNSKAMPLTVYNDGAIEVLERDLIEVSLRLIKDGKLGVSIGSIADGTDKILNDALQAAKFGVPVDYSFPKPAPFDNVEIFDPKLVTLTPDNFADIAMDIFNRMKKKAPDITINVYLDKQIRNVRILNSNGMDQSYDITQFTTSILSKFYRSKEGVNKEFAMTKYFDFPEEKIDELITEFRNTEKLCNVPSKKMPVIFLPSATWSILYRIMVGASGENFVKNITPLADKIDKQIFSDKITVLDDPTMRFGAFSAPFDDEGVPSKKKYIVEKGIFKNFLFDLSSGAESGKGSTGNGLKVGMWNRGIDIHANPRPTNLVLQPGNMKYDEMVKDINEGVIIIDVIGFHSGNMLEGEYSMNVGVGCYVKNGKIQGRAVDTMVAGNIYEDFFNIKGLSNELDYNNLGYSPAMYFTDISVSGTG
ncbi:TldD/PmbA family protein [bacterium]|nr:TldD/PmbA family protein [bacterium]